MEQIIQILMLFIFLNCVIKLSFWKGWQAVLFGAICALFVILAWPYAILQSKTQIADYLNNRSALQDAAVLITLESAICLWFCFTALQALFGRKVKRFLLPLKWYPSLLIFPVLFYVLTQSVFSLSGVSFSTIAYGLAGAVFLLLPLCSLLIKRFAPELELRLEVHFLVSLFVCILGLLTTVNADVTYAATEEPIHWKTLGISCGLFLVAFAIGAFANKLKWSVHQRKEEKKAEHMQHKQS